MKELALHLLDVAENGIRAGAKHIGIRVEDDPAKDRLILTVEDDGCGMSLLEQGQVWDPDFTTRQTRKVGLGLPLLKQHAEMTGGYATLWSEQGQGTRTVAVFGRMHPDRQPLGDLEGCWVLLASGHPGIHWTLECISGKGEYRISTEEIHAAIGEREIRGSELMNSLKRLIRNNMEDIGLNRDELE